MQFNRGSEWTKWDLQVQTRVDKNYSCSGNHLTEEQLATLSKLTGIEKNKIKSQEKEITDEDYSKLFLTYVKQYTDINVLAITDHNTGDSLDSLIKNCAGFDLGIIPGVEVASSQGIHMLCLFTPKNYLYNKATWKSSIETFLIKIGIDTPYTQSYPHRLNQSNKSTAEIMDIVEDCKGLCIFAHIATENGLFNNKAQLASEGSTHIDIYRNPLCKVVQIPSQASLAIGTQRILNGEDNNYGNKKCVQIKCSDSRKLTDIGKYYTWIKAEPTLEGFKQALIHPQNRVYIGEIPPKLHLIKNSPNKFLDRIEIKLQNGKESNPEKWFDNTDIPLNYDLVAIIGNKGSGKSALADIIAFVGGRKKHNFSFLTDRRFHKRAEFFEARCLSKDETNKTRDFVQLKSVKHEPKSPINDEPHARIEYIPQYFFERLCSQSEDSNDKEEFNREIHRIILAHIPEHENHEKKETLDQLQQFVLEEIKNQIEQLKAQVKSVNKQILEIENKLSQSYRLKIQSTKEELEKEKTNLGEKPTVLENQTNPETIAQLDMLRQEVHEQETKVSLIIQQFNDSKIQLDNLEKIEQSLNIFKESYITFEKKFNSYNKDINLNFCFPIIDFLFTHQQKKLATKRKLLENEKKLKSDELTTNKEHLVEKQQQLTTLINSQNEEVQEIEKAKNNLDEWVRRSKEIEDSISKTEQSNDKQKLVEELTKLQKQRNDFTKAIHDQIMHSKAKFEQLLNPLLIDLEELEKEHILESNQTISLNVTIKADGFIDQRGIFSFTNNRLNPFCGDSRKSKEETCQTLYNFNLFDEGEASIVSFFNYVLGNTFLTNGANYSDDKGLLIDVDLDKLKNNLRDPKLINELYDYLFCLEYLEPVYEIKYRQKNIESLSAGERGALLLTLYLFLDKNEYTLIIDQPEANLDNDSIYKTLVPLIQKAKQHRQIIIVTHNPNIALCCDAEQIIYCEHIPADSKKITYTSGAIESEKINKHLLEILEGGQLAFTTRDDSYLKIHV